MANDSIRITGTNAINYAEHVGQTLGYRAEDGSTRFVDVESARNLAKDESEEQRLFFELPYATIQELSLKAANEGDRPLIFTCGMALRGDTMDLAAIAAGVCACVLIERAK